MIIFIAYLSSIVTGIHIVCTCLLFLPLIVLVYGSISDDDMKTFIEKNKRLIICVISIVAIATIINVLLPDRIEVLELLSIYKRGLQ